MRRFLKNLGISRAWDLIWTRRSTGEKVAEFAVALLVTILGGIVVLRYGALMSSADLRVYTQSSNGSWTVGFVNDGDVPARDLLAHLHFAEPIVTHSQTPDVFIFAGQYVNSSTLLSGQDDVTLHCNIVPAHRRYQVIFAFGEVLSTSPDVDVTISNGRIVEH